VRAGKPQIRDLGDESLGSSPVRGGGYLFAFAPGEFACPLFRKFTESTAGQEHLSHGLERSERSKFYLAVLISADGEADLEHQ
jgi:hypothetical protein